LQVTEQARAVQRIAHWGGQMALGFGGGGMFAQERDQRGSALHGFFARDAGEAG
jgi:hypothetical protein